MKALFTLVAVTIIGCTTAQAANLRDTATFLAAHSVVNGNCGYNVDLSHAFDVIATLDIDLDSLPVAEAVVEQMIAHNNDPEAYCLGTLEAFIELYGPSAIEYDSTQSTNAAGSLDNLLENFAALNTGRSVCSDIHSIDLAAFTIAFARFGHRKSDTYPLGSLYDEYAEQHERALKLAGNDLFGFCRTINLELSHLITPSKKDKVNYWRTRDAQLLLHEAGYDVGKIDGAMGPRTQAAIDALEAKHGLDDLDPLTDYLAFEYAIVDHELIGDAGGER